MIDNGSKNTPNDKYLSLGYSSNKTITLKICQVKQQQLQYK